MTRRLHRSSVDAMIGGVCGGLGEYFGIDPMLVRIAFVISALVNGLGIMVYIILWIIVPQREQLDMEPGDVVRVNLEELRDKAHEISQDIHGALSGETAGEIARRRTLWFGAAVVLFGAGVLLKNLGLLRWLNLGLLWPAILVALGVLLLLKGLRQRNS